MVFFKCGHLTDYLVISIAWSVRIKYRHSKHYTECLEVKEIFAAVKQLKQFQIKPNGFEPMTSAIIGAMLYRLSYEASPEAAQVRVKFIPVV